MSSTPTIHRTSFQHPVTNNHPIIRPYNPDFINTFEHMSHLRISAVVCAAGTSSRMGKENKLLISIPEISMIEHTIRQIADSMVSELIVVTGFESEKISLALPDHSFKIKTVFNPVYSDGQTSSVQAGIRSIGADMNAVMICLSDMPYLLTSHYNQLISRYKQLKNVKDPVIIRPICDNQPGHPVIMDCVFIPQILSCTDANGPRSVIQQNHTSFKPWANCDRAYFIDIDSPKDLEAFRSKNIQ